MRLVGPPGCGKTRRLSEVIAATAAKHGGERLLVTSFTKAAAREIAGRTDLPADRVGTLHSHCWRALGRPTVAEGKLKEWNARVAGDPDLALTDAPPGALDDPYADVAAGAGEGFGDQLCREVQLLRARLVQPERWPPSHQRWWGRWRDWLNETGYLDFTALLEVALREAPAAPGAPAVMFVDEAQDCSPLQFALLRRWGAACDLGTYTAADQAQAIYGFQGASPELFHQPPLPPQDYEHLRQSYRLPAAVHEVAERWVNRSSDAATALAGREYAPRRERGAVHLGGEVCGSATEPEDYVARAGADAARPAGPTWMFLASCDYLLARTIGLLREQGVPFWNRYRPAHGGWNPMRGGPERLRDFLAPVRPDLFREDGVFEGARLWTWQELARWSELVPADGLLVRGARKQVEARVRDDREARRSSAPLSTRELVALLEEPARASLEAAMKTPKPWLWLAARVAPRQRRMVDYALTIAERRGCRALVDEPRVTVGTVHSVKGGESSRVVLYPDLSPAGYKGWTGAPAERDAVRRQMYVGMTRAQDELYLGEAATDRAVDWTQ